MSPIPSVLIVDDENGVRESLSAIFQEHGSSRICAVPSAEEAFEVMKKEPFSLIICDYLLQGMNGVAFMGKLRMRGDLTPILFISGVPNNSEVIHAAEQLKTAFLAKPFRISELMEKAARLLA